MGCCASQSSHGRSKRRNRHNPSTGAATGAGGSTNDTSTAVDFNSLGSASMGRNSMGLGVIAGDIDSETTSRKDSGKSGGGGANSKSGGKKNAKNGNKNGNGLSSSVKRNVPPDPVDDATTVPQSQQPSGTKPVAAGKLDVSPQFSTLHDAPTPTTADVAASKRGASALAMPPGSQWGGPETTNPWDPAPTAQLLRTNPSSTNYGAATTTALEFSPNPLASPMSSSAIDGSHVASGMLMGGAADDTRQWSNATTAARATTLPLGANHQTPPPPPPAITSKVGGQQQPSSSSSASVPAPESSSGGAGGTSSSPQSTPLLQRTGSNHRKSRSSPIPNNNGELKSILKPAGEDAAALTQQTLSDQTTILNGFDDVPVAPETEVPCQSVAEICEAILTSDLHQRVVSDVSKRVAVRPLVVFRSARHNGKSKTKIIDAWLDFIGREAPKEAATACLEPPLGGPRVTEALLREQMMLLERHKHRRNKRTLNPSGSNNGPRDAHSPGPDNLNFLDNDEDDGSQSVSSSENSRRGSGVSRRSSNLNTMASSGSEDGDRANKLLDDWKALMVEQPSRRIVFVNDDDPERTSQVALNGQSDHGSDGDRSEILGA